MIINSDNCLTVSDIKKSIEVMDEFVDGKYEFLELKNPSRNLIASLIDRIEITEDNNIDIYYKFKLV